MSRMILCLAGLFPWENVCSITLHYILSGERVFVWMNLFVKVGPCVRKPFLLRNGRVSISPVLKDFLVLFYKLFNDRQGK